jgi:hypothetical protein
MREHRKQQAEAIKSGETELARLRLENTQLEGQAAKMDYVETLLAQATSLWRYAYQCSCFASTNVRILTALGAGDLSLALLVQTYLLC